MKKAFFILAVLAVAGCTNGGDSGSKGDKNPPPDNSKDPVVVFTAGETEAVTGAQVEIRAQVTIGQGSIESVELFYNDGTEKNKPMERVGTTDEYSAGLTAKSAAGGEIYYFVVAESAAGETVQSGSLILKSYNPGELPDNSVPARRLRLTEVSTYGTRKFIEIYNPTGKEISLDGVAIYKNGEVLKSFGAGDKLPALRYGVLKARDASFYIPSTETSLGTINDVGLSGTKSLSIELRKGTEVIDAFANTINPGVKDMTAEDWDRQIEFPGMGLCDFFRKSPSSDGWWGAAGNNGGTPGKPTDTATANAGVQLKHQYFKRDGLPSMPYIDNIVINPADNASGNTPVGLTPAKNVIRYNVYTDEYNAITTSTGTKVSGVIYEYKPTLTVGGSPKITLKATNSVGEYSADEMTLTVFATSTAFGTYTDIRLNEIRMTDGDYIELYNTSAKPVLIGGMRIRKDKDRIFDVPAHMAITGNGYAVLGCDDDMPAASTGYLTLGVVSNGMSGTKPLLLELRRPKIAGDPDDENSTNIDSFVNTSVTSPNKDNWDNGGKATVEKAVNQNASPAQRGVGRKIDGTGEWYLMTKTTLGAGNSGSTTTGSAFTHKYSQ